MSSKFDVSLRDLSVNEACAIIGVSPPTLYKLISNGQLEAYKVGRSRRITGESMHRLRSGGKTGSA